MAAAPDDLVEEILLRLPPDDPAHLLRASIVCKDWGGIVSRPPFRRRLHELHPTPPVLGFLRGRTSARFPLPHFIPTTASSFSPAAPDWHSWRAQDCRHGRALFFSTGQRTLELLVWEPTTGAQQRVPVPAAFGSWFPMAAVLCAADGCDHRDCLGGPFRVVFSFADVPEDFDPEEGEWVRSLTVYSSETGTWGELTSAHSEFFINYDEYSSLLVGSSLLYFRGVPAYTTIMEYDVARHALTVLEPPGACSRHGCTLMLTEDGGLGVIEGLFYQHVILWTWEAISDTEARWVLSREICLDNLLPTGATLLEMVRFVEEANVILISTVAGLFTIELESEQVRKVCNDCYLSDLIPVVGFYTPVPRGEHQNLLPLKPSEEAGRGEEKKVDQAQLLFNKGSNAIKEGDFVNTFESISHGHNMRVPRYEEVALEGASTLNIYGCTLLPKAAPNEESVMGTSRKDDAGNSTTSGSNVECAPPSEKGDS